MAVLAPVAVSTMNNSPVFWVTSNLGGSLLTVGNAVIAQGSSNVAIFLVIKAGFSVLASDSLAEACPSL